MYLSTASGFTRGMGFGFMVLLVTVAWMAYRIAVGWYALTDGKPIENGKA